MPADHSPDAAPTTPERPTNTYTVAQLAVLLQCSQRHVWRLTDQGKLPGKLRLGRLVRFSRPQIDAWLVGQAKPSR